MPKQGHLLTERVVGGHEPVQPARTGASRLETCGLVRMIPSDQIVGHRLWFGEVEQLVDRRLVAFGCIGVKLLPIGPESGATQQVGDQLVFIAH